MRKNTARYLFLTAALAITQIGSPHAEEADKGIGTVTSPQLGPALKGLTQRRPPEWIMNMILNPQELPQKIPAAIKLLEEYMAQRDSVDLTQDNARAILEHFGNADSGGDTQARLQPKSTKARKS